MEGLNHRLRIRLDTQSDIIRFVDLANKFYNTSTLYIIDGSGKMCISARSLLGCMYAREFDNMWLISDNEKIHTFFGEFSY